VAERDAAARIGAEIVPTGIVGHEHDDVWPLLLRFHRRADDRAGERRHKKGGKQARNAGNANAPLAVFGLRQRNRNLHGFAPGFGEGRTFPFFAITIKALRVRLSCAVEANWVSRV
jgi:hypothetical protein